MSALQRRPSRNGGKDRTSLTSADPFGISEESNKETEPPASALYWATDGSHDDDDDDDDDASGIHTRSYRRRFPAGYEKRRKPSSTQARAGTSLERS